MKIKSKKHWYSYTLNIFLMLVFGVPALILYSKTSKMPDVHSFFSLMILLFGIWVFYRTIRAIILNYRVEWLFEDNILTVKSGLLPWRRSIFEMDISQIFEAYYTKSFMGTILGFGGVHIRRTDGVTSAVSQFTMTNHRKIVSAINKGIDEYKKKGTAKNETPNARESLSDELKKLADLNKDGVISDDEFGRLKQKLLE